MASLGITLKSKTSSSFSVFKALAHIQKNLIFWIPTAMILGFIYGNLIDPGALKKLIIPATLLMVYPMMVTLNIKKLFVKGGLSLLSITQLVNFILIPALGFALGLLFFKDNLAIRIGLLLITLIPTSGMTITWTGISKGNVPEAIRMTVAGLLLGALLTPIYLNSLLGADIHIPTTRIFTQILIIVFAPLILGFATQQLLLKKYGQEHFQKNIKTKFPPVSTLGVLFMVFIAMALKAKGIIANPEFLLKLIIPLLLLYVLMFTFSTILAKLFFKPADGKAMVFGIAMRNLSIALAIAMSVFKEIGSEIALVIAFAFIFQVQAAVWYVKFANKILK